MTRAFATCPASISLLFKMCPDKNILKMGSVGIGFTVDRNITVEASTSPQIKILFNGKPIYFPTVSTVIELLSIAPPVTLSITSSLPLGFGFGISGASALSTAFVLDRLFNLHQSDNRLIGYAHKAEIINKTGLGSVATQVTGGFLLKTIPGIPTSAVKFPFAGRKIYAVIIGKLETPRILNSPIIIRKINQAADLTIQTINKLTHPTLEQFIDLSCQSARMSGLLINPKVIDLIEEIRISGGHATMTRLGDVVISNIKPKTKYRIEELRITDSSIYSRNLGLQLSYSV